MNEFRRLINRKVVIGFIALLVINVSLYVYQQTKGAGLKELRFETVQRQWCVDYYGDYDIEAAINAVNSDIEGILTYRKADKQGTVVESEVQADAETGEESDVQIGAETEVLEKYKSLSEREQLLFLTVLRDIESQLEYIKKYPEDMKQIQTNAQQLMTFSIFSDKNSFTYNNIVKTGKDFEKVADVSLYLVNNKATGSFVNYYYTFYFALIMMVFIIYGLSGERDNGMWGIVHSAGSGRLRLALHRLFIIAGSGVVIAAGLYFTTFAAALLLYGGAGALNAPVQSIQAFERFAMPMSQIGFVLYNYVYSVLAVVVLSVALWAVFVVNRKRNHALILTGVVVGLEVLMYYRIGLHSIYSALKQINIVRLMKVNEVISTYANRGRGSFVISESAIMFWALMVILVASVSVAVMGTVLMRPSQGKNVLTRLTDKLYAGYQHIFANVPVVFKELHKLLVTSRGFTVIVVLLLVVMYFISYGKMAFSDNSRERDRIYLEKGGADYSQIFALIDERRADYMQAVEKSMEAAEQYENGEIEIDELSQINSTVSIYASRYAAVREFEQKQEYLENLKEETGIDGYMMSDRDMRRYLASTERQERLFFLWLCLCLLCLLFLRISELRQAQELNILSMLRAERIRLRLRELPLLWHSV